ncbi:hypothetical protein R80B4_01091 [Fibrobacteres bacterium R8-0-B4]
MAVDNIEVFCDAEEYIKRGDEYLGKSEFDSAIADYTEAIRLSPDNAMAYRKRGNVYAEMFDAYAWIEFSYRIHRIIRIRKGSDDGKKYDLAVADFTEALRLDPNNAEVYFQRGGVHTSAAYLYRDRAHYCLAIADYTKAIRLDPNMAEAYSKRGDAYAGCGYVDKSNAVLDFAIADYTEAIRLNPDNAMAYYDRGGTYKNKGDFDNAIANYTEAIARLGPGDLNIALAHFCRGNAYKEKDEIKNARADYEEAIRLDPKCEEAKKALKAIARNDGLSKEEHCLRAGAYLKNGDVESAVADYLKAKTRDCCFGDKGFDFRYYESAIADCTEAISSDPNNANAYLIRGFVYRALGNDILLYEHFDCDDFCICDIYRVDRYDLALAIKYATSYNLAAADRTEAFRLDPKLAITYEKINRKLDNDVRGRSFWIDYDDLDHADVGRSFRIDNDYDEEESIVYLNRSDIDKDEVDYDGCIANLTEAIRRDPKDARAYVDRGDVYKEKGDYDLAVADCMEAIRLKPNSPVAYKLRGEIYADKGDIDLAIADYTQTIKRDNVDVDAYCKRGNLYKEKGDYDLAVADYARVIKLDRKKRETRLYINDGLIIADAYYNRGDIHKERGDADSAVADYVEAYKIRATAYGNSGEFDKAVANCTEAIRLKPDSAELRCFRSNMHLKNGGFESAVADFTEAIRLKPNDAELLCLRGNMYLNNGNVESAVADFAEAIRLDADGTESRGCFGYGDYFDRIIKTIIKAIRCATDLTTAYKIRGLAYPIIVKTDKNVLADTVIADLTETIRLDPNNATAYLSRGIAYCSHNVKKTDKGIADFTKAISLAQASAEAYFRRGNAHKKMGSIDNAIADYEEAIRLDPGLGEAKKALAELRGGK